jgi:3-oxoacyl-[acyl-carrier protein] reductase
VNLELNDKIAMVIGASSGIGAATALVLAQEGAHVVLSYAHHAEDAERLAQAVRQVGRQAWLLKLDLMQPEAAAAAAEQVKAQVEALDLIILCAGQNIVTPFEAITPAEWEQVLGVNLNGAFYALQALAPLLRPGSSIVTVASVAAQTGAPHHMHYAAAKAGLVNLTKSLARHLAPHIRVNCVSPGLTLTAMGEATIQTLEPDYASKKLLVQRFATPEEIARCIVFIASPVNGFMTGATIDVNGGRDLR